MPHNTKETVNSARYHWIVVTAAVVPFVCAVVAQAMGPTPQESVKQSQTTSLTFDQYLIDLGEVPPLPVLETKFRFTNRGDQPVTIKELNPSCGCLQPKLETSVYQPGETGEFSVRVQTTGEQPGPKSYYVDVVYEDATTHQVQLAFDFVLPERKVVVNPKALIFYQMGAASTTREVIVTDYREAPLNVLDWSCKSPYVTAVIGETKTDKIGTRTVAVAVTVDGNIPVGRHEALLRLKTDDLKHPELVVPLWIQGVAGPIRQAGGEEPTRRHQN